jgi:hypothetical protein
LHGTGFFFFPSFLSIFSALIPFSVRIRSLRVLWAGYCTHTVLLDHNGPCNLDYTRTRFARESARLAFGVHWTRHAVVDTGVYRRNHNVEVVSILLSTLWLDSCSVTLRIECRLEISTFGLDFH